MFLDRVIIFAYWYLFIISLQLAQLSLTCNVHLLSIHSVAEQRWFRATKIQAVTFHYQSLLPVEIQQSKGLLAVQTI